MSTKAVSIPSKIPPCIFFHQNTVTVEIGSEKKAYSIHKDLLVFYSDYFRAAFNGSFTEAAEGKIRLPHERVEVFNIVTNFVYTRQLSDGVDCDIAWELLCRLWIFGDKYLMPALQNKAMSTLIEQNRKLKVIPVHCVKLIYDNTLPGSPLRKIVVDWTAYKTDMLEFMALEKENPRWTREALVDLVLTMGAKTKEDIGRYALPEGNNGKCYYHVHKDGEQC
ncbi:hypothetical protein KCU67_g1728, partial [Aureobasidium melanogenum]